MPDLDQPNDLALFRGGDHAMRRRLGFTLVELLVVLGIILGVSVLALPTVVSAINARGVTDSARILHAALVGARDAAQMAGSPRGLRFLPDPSIPLTYLPNSNQLDPSKALACNRWVQTEIPGNYTTGLASIYPRADYTTITGGLPCLVLEEQPGHFEQSGAGYAWVLDEPTNWWWTIRVGEKITIKSQTFTVCGPNVIPPQGITINGQFYANPETFVNNGVPGASLPWTRTYTAPDGTQHTDRPQFLFLVNGKDDNGDGFIDNGWDGIDNNENGAVDEFGEWELESWPGTLTTISPGNHYSIVRRPVPSPGQQATTLPGNVVIDLTTWNTTAERSHLPVNPYTGQVDLVIEADGSIRPDLPYGTQSSLGLGSSFYHWWLTDRDGVVDAAATQGSYLTLPIPPALQGNRWLVQAQARTGRVSTGEIEQFATDATQLTAPSVPFLPYRQGL